MKTVIITSVRTLGIPVIQNKLNFTNSPGTTPSTSSNSSRHHRNHDRASLFSNLAEYEYEESETSYKSYLHDYKLSDQSDFGSIYVDEFYDKCIEREVLFLAY